MERFVIGERGVGEVAFLHAVDLLSLELDSIVRFTRGRVQLYGGASGPRLPSPGPWAQCSCACHPQVRT